MVSLARAPKFRRPLGAGRRRATVFRLERWQWAMLTLAALASLGGIFQLTQVRRHTKEWEGLLERVSRTVVHFRISPDLTEVDEKGRVRRLHEYFGEFPWNRESAFTANKVSPVDLWLLQLSRFEYDHRKLQLEDPTWQSVECTWRTGAGVCRDSATVLADMLERAGYDARMVAGFVDGPRWGTPGGHAWVGLVDPASGKEYLLESTGKTQGSNMRTPPLYAIQSASEQYHSEMQVAGRGYYTKEDSAEVSGLTKGWIFQDVRR